MKKTKIQLHEKQWEAYNFKTQFGAIIAGVQSGKTFCGACWAAKKMEEFPDKDGLIFAVDYPMLRQATLRSFFSSFPEYEKYFNKHENVIKLPTGGNVYIRSAQNPNRVEGMTIHWAWGDEAGQMKRQMWNVVKSRVSTTGGQIFLTTTPYNMGWLYRELYLPAIEGEVEDTTIFTWPSTENPYQDEEFIAAEKKRLRPEEFKRRYEGEFAKLTGLIWDLPDNQVLKWTPHMKRSLKFTDDTVAGVDWGYNHPTAIVVVEVKDGNRYIVDEWKESKKTTPEILKKMDELHKKHGINRWYPDPAEPDRIDDMKRAGFTIGAVDKRDVSAGLSHVAGLIREEKFYVMDNCKQLIDEIEQYQYEIDSDDELTDSPVKEHDDLCDALRYVCYAIKPMEPETRRRLYRERLRRSREQNGYQYG